MSEWTVGEQIAWCMFVFFLGFLVGHMAGSTPLKDKE
jgi:hypothetical protein